MTEPVTIQSKHISFAEGGVNRTEVLQQFADRATEDLATLADRANDNTASIDTVGNTVIQEMTHVKTQINALKIKNDFRERNSDTLVHTVDFHNKERFFYAENSSPNLRLILDQRYGQVYLPYTYVTPLFFIEDPSSGNITINRNMEIRVKSISEGVSGGLLPSITPGNVFNAVNGYNTSYWVRKVEYPLESPVTEVEMEVEIIVPEGAPTEFNTFNVSVHPLGRVDITGIWYKEKATSPYTILEEFPKELPPNEVNPVPVPINEAKDQQFIGQVRPVYSFKIRLRQRDWIRENNKKVFVYGAQEIGAFLIRHTNINSISPFSTNQNAHIIYKVPSPASTAFGSITKIAIGPNPKSEGTTLEDNHVIYQLSKVPNPQSSADILWTSHTSPLPQNGSPIVLDELSEYYVIISMKYVTEITKDLSVFKNGTTPVVEYIAINHTLISLDDFVESAASVDWTCRNAAQHFQNIMLMDSYRGAIEDGSNVFIFWDDMWNDAEWRAALEFSTNNTTFSPSYMALRVEQDAALMTGNIQYIPLTPTDWGAMTPRRFRLQTAISNISGSKVDFIVDYSLDAVPQTAITISHATLVANRGSIPWSNIPGSDTQTVTAMSVKIVLTNGTAAGARPNVHQFALIVKD